MTRDELLVAASPILAVLRELNADDPEGALMALSGVSTDTFEAALRQAHAEGWLTPKEAGGVRFGRLSKPSPESKGFSIDIVEMSGPASGAHTHLTGEFDLCFALEGAPRFDGHGLDGASARWLVYPPGSRHIPVVSGGRMLIAYFLPEGRIQFE